MIILILGASGKVGKYLSEEIAKNPSLPVTELILHYSSKSVNLTPNARVNLRLLEMDILDPKSVENFLSKLPQKIDIVMNLLSVFGETGYNICSGEVEKVLRVNFLNQVLLLRELFPRVSGGVVIQFFDYCVRVPYVGKYFWYSLSRSCLYEFFRHFEEYARKTNQFYRFVYVFPKHIREEEYPKLRDKLFPFITVGGGVERVEVDKVFI